MSDELDIRIDNDLAQNDSGNILGSKTIEDVIKKRRTRAFFAFFHFTYFGWSNYSTFCTKTDEINVTHLRSSHSAHKLSIYVSEKACGTRSFRGSNC